MNVLEVQNLSKSYDGKVEALRSCSFQLQKGSICAIVGESGSGKSTMLRLIAGLERPNSGTIRINGALMSGDDFIAAPQERKTGLVFQNYALFPHLTVRQNIQFGMSSSSEDQFEELMRLIKMEGFEKAYPSELSGGQQQRVAIARTLATHPDLLLLDEPFSNLDAALKTDLRQQIKSIVKQLDTTMLFITHDLVDALDIADEIIFLEEGRILQHSTIEALRKGENVAVVEKIIQELRSSTQKIIGLLD